MKATDLNKHIEAGLKAVSEQEQPLTEAVRKTLVQAGYLAARNFKKYTTSLTADGQAQWLIPHQDEVIDAVKLADKIHKAIEPRRERALSAFAGSLPACIPLPEQNSVQAAGKPCNGFEIAWDITNAYFGKAYARTGEHIDTITQTTRADVMQVIRDGYENGDSIPDVAKAIRESVRGSSEGRALTIARTELNGLQNGASLSAAEVVSNTAGVSYQKRWLTAPGAEHPRHETYDGLDGQTVMLDELFDVGGVELAYPGDPDGEPDEIINCRCSMEYVEGDMAATGDIVDLSSIEASGQPDAGLPFEQEIMEGDSVDTETEAQPVVTFTTGTNATTHLTKVTVNGQTYVPAVEATVEVEEALEAMVAAPLDEALLPEEHQPADVRPDEQTGDPAAVEQRTNAAQVRWNAIFAPEGKATDDGRIFAPNSIGHRDLPLSLMAMTETPGEGGHAGAQLAGRIDEIYRDTSGKPTLVLANGVFDDSDFGHEIARLVDEGYLTGNSVDLAVTDSKIVLAADVVDEDGFWLEGVNIDDVPEVSILDIFFGEVDAADVLFVVTEAKIGMSTVCPFPAFAEATISITASAGVERKWAFFQGVLPHLQTVQVDNAIRIPHGSDGLTASAAGMVPVVPPQEWFQAPQLDALTPLTVTDEGRVYGHAWQWGECHIGLQDACTVAPHSNTDYAYFLLKEVETAEGEKVEVGTITLDTNHANQRLGWRDAAAHYDHTGTAVADVTFGEDEHGGWFAGSLRPEASAEAVRKFRRGSVSGDWRRIHGNLELVGLLTVNVPGFPIPRTKALVAAANEGMEVLALVAAGVATDKAQITEITEADKAVLAALASGEMGELVSLAEQARTL